VTSENRDNNGFREKARLRQSNLVKPPGSLGRLEDVAVRLADILQTETPTSRPARALVFASDHPVAANGVSAYPAEITTKMMTQLSAGRAACTVMAETLHVPLEVIDVGVAAGYSTPGAIPVLRESVADAPAGDLRTEDAMSPETFSMAVAAGEGAVSCLPNATKVLILGEIGIGNTTPAAAVASAVLNRPAEDLVGPGTGLDEAGIRRKRRVVEEALDRPRADGAREALRCLGGRELAAMAGATMAAAHQRMAVLVDGFVVTAAVAAAVAMRPVVRSSLLFGHCSAEPGHQLLLEHLAARPLLELDLRLGEGTGALAALPLLDLACSLHNGMSTFEEAGLLP